MYIPTYIHACIHAFIPTILQVKDFVPVCGLSLELMQELCRGLKNWYQCPQNIWICVASQRTAYSDC